MMASEFDALSIGVSLAGVSTVLAGLSNLTNSLNNTGAAADRFSRTAAVFTAAAATIGASAIKAYDSFVKFQIGAESLLGTLEGRRFASAIQKMAVGNAYSADILRRGSQGLVASGMGSGRAQSVLGAITNIAAAGGTDNAGLERALMAIRQINAKGTVRGEEANQQLADTMPLLLKAVQDLTGRNTVVGMSKDEFLNAVVTAGTGKYAGAQENLASKSPGIVLQNTMDNIKNVLIPTGLLLAKALILILKPINAWIGMLSKINEASGGLLGLFGVFKLLQFAGSMMVKWWNALAGTTTKLSAAELGLLSASERLSVGFQVLQSRLFSIVNQNTGGVSKSSTGLFNMPAKTFQDFLREKGTKELKPKWVSENIFTGTVGGFTQEEVKTPAKATADLVKEFLGGKGFKFKTPFIGPPVPPVPLTNLLTGMFDFIKPFLKVGNLLKGSIITAGVMLAIEVLPRLFTNIGKIIGWFAGAISKAWESFSKTPIGSAITALFDFLGSLWETLVSFLSMDWLVSLLGIEDEVDQNNADKISESLGTVRTPNRPIRSSDPEIFFYSRLSQMR